MKTFALLFAALYAFQGSARAEIPGVLNEDKIYFFYSSECPRCQEAVTFLNKNHPNLEMELVNADSPEGKALFEQGRRKFGISLKSGGSHLMCMGDSRITGWTKECEDDFDFCLSEFLPKCSTGKE